MEAFLVFVAVSLAYFLIVVLVVNVGGVPRQYRAAVVVLSIVLYVITVTVLTVRSLDGWGRALSEI